VAQVHRVWLIPTPTSLYYKPRVVDRLWQPRIELQRRGTALTKPTFGNPSRRNQERLDGSSKARVRLRRTFMAYPATAGDAPHGADVSGLETEGDRRRARNGLKRRRQGR
jgi:uncharacterized protein involved in type VI secretion and phage assembly